MVKEWEDIKVIAGKSLKKMVEMEYIKVNEYVSMEGLASIIANEMVEHEREKEKTMKIQQLIDLIKELFPDKLKYFTKND